MGEGSCTLNDSETDRLNVKLEEDSRDANVVTDFPLIVRHAILVRMQRFRAWCDVCGWNDPKIVLICNKICELSRVAPAECIQHTIMCHLERVVEGLGNLWEMFAKGKFSDHMGKVHDYWNVLGRE